MRTARVLVGGLGAMALVGSLAVGTATAQTGGSAAEAAAATCPYPYVCLIKNDTRIGMFQDVTSGYQNLPSRPTGPNLTVVNTRNDDIAFIRKSDGSVTCVAPRTNHNFGFSAPALTGIRISSQSTCP